jgi:hypothetical protein
MNYLDIRNKFIELSGRYDLTNNDQTDSGADFFLNAGQKYLDRLMDSGKMVARFPSLLSAGTFIVKSVGVRSIKEVWAANADGKYPLIPDTLQKLREEYSEEFSAVPQGAPKYYAPAVFRPFPDTLATSTGMYNVSDILLYNATAPSQHFNYNGIVIMPPPDGIYTIEIVGLFYSPTLYATLADGTWTQSASYWTEVHPETLIAAALFKLEGFYRNTEGAKDFKATVMDDMTGLDFDLVEEDLTGTLQMGG